MGIKRWIQGAKGTIQSVQREIRIFTSCLWSCNRDHLGTQALFQSRPKLGRRAGRVRDSSRGRRRLASLQRARGDALAIVAAAGRRSIRRCDHLKLAPRREQKRSARDLRGALSLSPYLVVIITLHVANRRVANRRACQDVVLILRIIV